MRATREEIRDFLADVPDAPDVWVDILYAARIPMSALTAYVNTMILDVNSPLRRAEDEKLLKEIARLNGVFGEVGDDGKGNGKTLVRVAAVVTTTEKMRITNLTSNFCQVDIKQNGKFGRNGHIVCNVVRRCTAGYNYARLPKGASVVEVGADVKNWLVDSSSRPWEEGKLGSYVSARPVINRRDVQRVKWEDLVQRILTDRNGAYSETVKTRAGVMECSYDGVFPNVKIQDLDARGEYIISNDANYDIKFSDMPRVMISLGARAWYGTMLRVKGLTTCTRLTSGELPLMNVNYRVDWSVGRIDFRSPNCNAFGYSHDVRELVKYEQNNGYVWSTKNAHYVYSKGAETNDEILFFSVVRVSKAIYMKQINYVENPNAGMTRIQSVWAVGGWSDGIPTKFEPIEYDVDTSAFGRVFEKRRAIDSKGDLSVTMTLVRSTNVRMWLNGVPVGTNKKIEAALTESVAVTIETIVSQLRLGDNRTFDVSMQQYKICVEKGSWIYSLLEKVIDLRAITGMIVAPVSRAWGSMRGALADVALSSMSGLNVTIGVVPKHVKLPMLKDIENIDKGSVDFDGDGSYENPYDVRYQHMSKCGLKHDNGVACESCDKAADEWVNGFVPKSNDRDPGRDPKHGSTVGSDSGVEMDDGSSEWNEPPVPVADEVKGSDNWMDGVNDDKVERRSMEELMELESYLQKAILTEVRIDSGRLMVAKCSSSQDVIKHGTTRTQHAFVKFKSGRHVETMGSEMPEFGAIYDCANDKIIKTVLRGQLVTASVKDGWYYTCNHLKVWNADDIISAARYALDYGSVSDHGKKMRVTLGVPGAGKTRGMIERLVELYLATGVNFLVLPVTKMAVKVCKEYAIGFGLDPALAEARIKTLDSYLINGKTTTELLCVDEYTMVHMGRVDAAIAISGARRVELAGDGRQIPYDPFTAGFVMYHSTLGGRVIESSVCVLKETHRCSEDVCAMWLDVYPSIYPCKCCRPEEKRKKTLSYVRIGGIEDVKRQEDVRYHGYTRAEVDQIADGLRMGTDFKVLKAKVNSGIASVHEDQGSTHKKVETIRLRADYDKNSTARNPSLYNRANYVLTDTTRHTESYVYRSNSSEDDLIRRRIKLSKDPNRIQLVREKKGMGLTTIDDMLSNKYNPMIVF